MEAIAIIVPVVVIAFVIIILISGFTKAGRSNGLVQLSHLRCAKCGNEFDYAWVPFVSFAAVRLFNSRYFACPVCKKWSVFNVWNTRVDPDTHYCGNIRIGPS